MPPDGTELMEEDLCNGAGKDCKWTKAPYDGGYKWTWLHDDVTTAGEATNAVSMNGT